MALSLVQIGNIILAISYLIVQSKEKKWTETRGITAVKVEGRMLRVRPSQSHTSDAFVLQLLQFNDT